MRESKVFLAHECVTTVIRNPLLRLGFERILDDLGLTSVTYHDGSVGLGDNCQRRRGRRSLAVSRDVALKLATKLAGGA